MFLVNVKSGVVFKGENHATPQTYFRDNGLQTLFADDLVVAHHQRKQTYREHYVHQLLDAQSSDKDNTRYLWFIGYTLFVRNDPSFRYWLSKAANSRHPLFPVEKMNACLFLSEVYCNEGDYVEALNYLQKALAFFKAVQHDDEVKINRYDLWMNEIEQSIETRSEKLFRRFAC